MNTELADLLRELELKVKKVTTPNFVICEFNNQRELKVAWTHKRKGFMEKFNTRWITFNESLLSRGPDFLLARVNSLNGADPGAPLVEVYGAWYSDAIKLNHMKWIGRGEKPVIAFSVGVFEKGKLKIYQALLHGRRQSVLL